MTTNLHAHRVGASASTNDDALTVAAAQRIQIQELGGHADFQSDGCADQAALTIEGEAYARAYLDRLHADAEQPGELTVLLLFLTGEMLNGACRLIEKALRGGRHA